MIDDGPCERSTQRIAGKCPEGARSPEPCVCECAAEYHMLRRNTPKYPPFSFLAQQTLRLRRLRYDGNVCFEVNQRDQSLP